MVWRLQGSSHHEVTPEGHEGPWRSAIENLRCKEMKIMKPRVTCCNIWNNDVTSLIIYNHMRILWGCVVHIRYIYIWYILLRSDIFGPFWGSWASQLSEWCECKRQTWALPRHGVTWIPHLIGTFPLPALRGRLFELWHFRSRFNCEQDQCFCALKHLVQGVIPYNLCLWGCGPPIARKTLQVPPGSGWPTAIYPVLKNDDDDDNNNQHHHYHYHYCQYYSSIH